MLQLWLIFCTILLAIVTISASGECIAAEESEPAEWSAEERHDLGLFLGGAHRGSEDGFSIGIDYEYRISPLFGFGGFIEYTAGDLREGVIGVPFYFHVWRELTLVGAPGVEFATLGRPDEFLVRIGGEYGIEIGRGFELAPGLYFDLTPDEITIVYGVALAKSF